MQNLCIQENHRERRASSLKKSWAESQIMHNQWRVTVGLIERLQKEIIVIEEREEQLHVRRHTIFAVCLQQVDCLLQLQHQQESILKGI